MKKKYNLYLITHFISFLFLLNFSLLMAAGLRTTFSSVLIENLKIGKKYSLIRIANMPLKIRSTFNRSIKINIKVLKPQQEELKPGYEAIPDTSWLTVSKPVLRLNARGSGLSDLIITIPNDEKYLGKKYQVMIWSYTAEKGIGCGLKSRLLLNTAQTNN